MPDIVTMYEWIVIYPHIIYSFLMLYFLVYLLKIIYASRVIILDWKEKWFCTYIKLMCYNFNKYKQMK